MSLSTVIESPATNQRRWKFFRAGGLDQVRLDSGAALLDLPHLDQKLWVTLSCPTRGLEFDPKTLDLIDTDHDGRIRCPEIIAAVQWAAKHLKNPDDLTRTRDPLPLSAINDQHEDGARLLKSARHILANLGKPDASVITVADTTDTARIFAQTQFNGDGVVPPESASDPDTKQAILDIINTLSGEVDRSGAVGVTEAKVEAFAQELRDFSDWWRMAQGEAGRANEVLPLGESTGMAWAAVQAVKSKIDDYFARCRLAAFDPRATAALNRSESEFLALAGQELGEQTPEIAALPLARIEAHRLLPLGEGINPAWGKAMQQFCSAALVPLLGSGKDGLAEAPGSTGVPPAPSGLAEADWHQLVARLAPYGAWLAAKKGSRVEKLGLDRVRQILAGSVLETVRELIARDAALAPEMAAISAVDRLARYSRDLPTLLNNYVAFADFYDPSKRAIFQAGTLYLDGRSCRLCLRVEDVAKHALMANLGRICLAYCEVRRRGGQEKMIIAAAFTAGTSERLVLGRNGLFYDLQGRDWDATVVKVLEHPISLREAVWAPFRRLGKLVNDQFEKIAAAREKTLQSSVTKSLDEVDQKMASAQTSGKPAAVAAPASSSGTGTLVGILAGGSVAVAALGSAFAATAKMFSSMSALSIFLTFLALFAVISGPSVLVAWFKLRARDLGPILDANGWAINSRIKLNMALGRALTQIAKLPEGAQRSLDDLYPDDAPKPGLWLWVILLLAATFAALRMQRVF